MGAASSSCSPCLCRERRDLLEEAAVGQQQDVSLVHVPAVASREEPKATTQQQVVVQERKVRTKKLKIVAEQDPDIIEELETPKQKQFLNFEQLIKEEEDNIEEEEDNIEEENIEQEQAVKEEKTITKPHIVHVQVTAEVHVDPSSVTTEESQDSTRQEEAAGLQQNLPCPGTNDNENRTDNFEIEEI
ncbi:uncharacterized protein LOC134186206 [Corticium candelabrum]|uniref:uncharacterized protein LOC134186206 n=1 Tax=Corticium candelabrum TaxID=121492 RepID=UPI002E273B66|nr:uncharacterized protein LOC134186206 [Corticium candelabrum]